MTPRLLTLAGAVLTGMATLIAQPRSPTDLSPRGVNAPPSERVQNLTLLAGPRQAWSRDAFLQLISRSRVDAAPEFARFTAPDAEGLSHARFTYASEAGQRVPGLWYELATTATDPAAPAKRRAAVIILHGTGGNKESVVDLLKNYARTGFVAIAIDGRHHGERATPGTKASADYQDAILKAWRTPGRSYPFFYDTAWDVLRLIDVLSQRVDIDAARIGLTGISKGGIETYLAAAADTRIAAAAPLIGVQSFEWALRNDAWQSRVSTIQTAVDAAAQAENATVDAAFVREFYRRVAPGLFAEFDGPSMLPLIAPRPLLVVNGDSDPRTPLAGVRHCVDLARNAYRDVGAAERIEFVAQPNTGHKVTPESHALVLEWFKRQLHP